MSNNFIKVTALEMPLSPQWRKSIVIERKDNERVADIAARAFPGAGLTNYACGGRLVDGDSLAVAGSELFAWQTPKDPGTVALLILIGKILVVTLSVVSAAYSVYSYMRTKKQMKSAKNALFGKEVSDASAENFGWDYDSANAVSEGGPLPILYGTRQVICPIIQLHTFVSALTSVEYFEALLAVCQGGAGFEDRISFLSDEDGDADVLVNHASWKNYISSTQLANDSSLDKNRVTPATTVSAGAYWENNQWKAVGGADLTGLIDGDLSTRAKGMADSQKYDSRNSPAKTGTSGTKYTRNLLVTLDDLCEITRVRLHLSRKETQFKVYASNASDIKTFVRIGVFSGNNMPGWKSCNCNTNGVFYNRVLITDFRYSADCYFNELEIYGSINSGSYEGINGYAEIETRAGGFNQAPVTICPNVWSKLNVSKSLDLTWFSFLTSPGASPDKMSIILEFPYGLYDSSGSSITAKEVKPACEYRGVDADGTPEATWHKFNNDFTYNIGGSYIAISDTVTSSKKVQLNSDESFVIGFDHYEIRMKFFEDPGLGTNVQGTCVWSFVEEGYAHQPIYPKTALLAIRMIASENLYGSIPQLKPRVSRPNVLVYNPIAGVWQVKPANNPAWAAYDMIVRPLFDDTGFTEEDVYLDASPAARLIINLDATASPDAATKYNGEYLFDSISGRYIKDANTYAEYSEISSDSSYIYLKNYGIAYMILLDYILPEIDLIDAITTGNSTFSHYISRPEPYFTIDLQDYLREEAFPHDKVLYSDFAKWADFCDVNQITMSMYFDGTSSVVECLQYVLEIGRASLVNRGSILGVVVDRGAENYDSYGRPIPVFKFDDSNIVAGTFKTSYRDRTNFPDEVQVTYYDKEREYTRKSVLVRDAISLYQNSKDITLYCCDDTAVARRHAKYIIGMNHIKRSFEWTGDLDCMPLDIGDLVKANDDVIIITGTTFDAEMRRQFSGIEYADKRYRATWEVAMAQPYLSGPYQTPTDGRNWIVFPCVPLLSTFEDLFTIAGELILSDVKIFSEIEVLYIDEDEKDVCGTVLESIPLSTTIEPGKGYKIYVTKSTEYNSLIGEVTEQANFVELSAGWNLFGVVYEIPDFAGIYSNYLGVNYVNKLDSGLYRVKDNTDNELEPLQLDSKGKQHLYPGIVYAVKALVAFDLPMFKII